MVIRGLARDGLFVLWMIGALLVSAEPHAQSSNDPAALEEARKLMTITKVIDLADQLAASQMRVLTDVIVKANPGSETAVRQIMEEVFMPEFRSNMPSLVNEMAGLYAIHFSADELRAMNAFYSTPVGMKAIATMPILLQQGMQLGQVWGQKIAETALKKAEPKFRERGINL